MIEYKGLIPNYQKHLSYANEKWEYGEVIDGVKHIDYNLGLGCFTLGFKRFDIIDYVSNNLKYNLYENAEDLLDTKTNVYLCEPVFELADKLYQLTGRKSIFSLSGSDANEGAIKLASAYHFLKNSNRKKIISFNKSYHGSTFLNYQIGNLFNMNYTLGNYENAIILDPEFNIEEIDWNDVICIVFETRQWGNGLKEYPIDFWKKLEYIRKEYDVVLINDDIFMGGGKTGSYLGCSDIDSDIITMGKGITGGYFPLSVCLYSKRIDEVIPNNFYWDHGFTYSFSMSGILSALKYIDILETENILENVKQVQRKAKLVFDKCNIEIINSIGTVHYVSTRSKLITLPLNANFDYFGTLYRENKQC